MKKLSAFILCLIMFACNNQSGDERTTERDTVTTEVEDDFYPVRFSKSFADLSAFILKQDSSFSSEKFADFQPFNMDSVKWNRMDEETFAEYREFFVYNADSSLALDLVSYNFIISNKAGVQKLDFAGPDTEIGLIDVKNKMRKRLLFLGSSGMVLDGKWDERGNVVLVGAQDAGNETFQPLLWRYYPEINLLETIPYAGVIKADLGSYYDVKYKPVIKTSRAA
jgi:hypothetical protein